MPIFIHIRKGKGENGPRWSPRSLRIMFGLPTDIPARLGSSFQNRAVLLLKGRRCNRHCNTLARTWSDSRPLYDKPRRFALDRFGESLCFRIPSQADGRRSASPKEMSIEIQDCYNVWQRLHTYLWRGSLMKAINRRYFLMTSLAAAGSGLAKASAPLGANSRIRVAVVGLRGRGGGAHAGFRPAQAPQPGGGGPV